MTASISSIRTDTPRSAIDRVDESTSDDSAAVTVVLHWDGADHVGEAAGPPGATVRPLLVARATLDALTSAGNREFEAIEASVTETASVSIALVAVSDPLLTNPLIGTAVMPDNNEQLGFARATLDAVNRRIDVQ
ncbi:MAG: hypothetical protein V3W36_03450 [Acidimicrobiia bacterium]